MRDKIAVVLIIPFLFACDGSLIVKKSVFENRFSLWKDTRAEYTQYLKEGYYLLRYDSTFEYSLTYKTGEKVEKTGTYVAYDAYFDFNFKDGTNRRCNWNIIPGTKTRSYYEFLDRMVLGDPAHEIDVIFHADKIF